MANISFKHVVKTYDNGVTVIPDLNLDIKDKEFVVLVGPSGCGKSTTLRMIAGLESISEGELYIGDKVVNDVAPKNRDIAMVFQSYALYPHMTVYKNSRTKQSTSKVVDIRNSIIYTVYQFPYLSLQGSIYLLVDDIFIGSNKNRKCSFYAKSSSN